MDPLYEYQVNLLLFFIDKNRVSKAICLEPECHKVAIVCFTDISTVSA